MLNGDNMEMDKYLKWALITMSLMIGFGIFYHYVVYLPGLEKQKEERAKEEKAKEEKRIAEEKRMAEEKETQNRSRYSICVSGAQQNYKANWAQACESFAKAQEQSLRACLSDSQIINSPDLGVNFCKRRFPAWDSSPNCSLPQAKADPINQTFKQEQDMCLAEARAGL